MSSDSTPTPGSEEPLLWEARLPDEAATVALGSALGRGLRGGQCLALVGDMGAGKTCVARGVGAGLGLEAPEEVASPTYLLVVEHGGPLPMLHVDAYLPGKLRWFLEDGGVDYLGQHGGVAVVEWAERVADLLPTGETLWLELAPAGDGAGGRIARLRGPQGFRELAAGIPPFR